MPTYDGVITAGIYYWWNGFQPSFCVATILRTECPLCAKSRHACASALIQRGGQTSVTARANTNICDLPIRGANRFSAARTKLQERSARRRPSRSTWCSGGPLAIRGFSYGWSLMQPEVRVYDYWLTIMLTDQVEQETHVVAVGSAFRRLGLIGPPHLAQVPYVPSDIRFRAASI